MGRSRVFASSLGLSPGAYLDDGITPDEVAAILDEACPEEASRYGVMIPYRPLEVAGMVPGGLAASATPGSNLFGPPTEPSGQE